MEQADSATHVPVAVDAAVIAAAVRAYLHATGVPGAAVAVTRGDHVLLADGYGHTPTGDRITEHTQMAVASVSKSFTALAIMKLVEAGSVDLDRSVRLYLPEFTIADPQADQITVRQLLNHTSGMSDRTFPAFSRQQPHSLREAVASMRTARLAAAPGSRWEYHNPNYQVAARLVEVVTDQSFGAYLREHVFEPLGMRDSRTIDTADDLPSSARGHLMILRVPLPVREPRAFGNGSGGVLSSAHDMAVWLIMQHKRGRGPDGTPILSPESIATMWASTAVSGAYGLGWFRGRTPSGAPQVSHSGDLFTSTAHQALLTSTGHGIAVMVNTGMAYEDARALANCIVALLEGAAPAPALAWPYVLVDAVMLSLTAGVILLAVRGVRRFRQWAARHHGRWTAVSLLPLLAPLVMLVTIHRLVGALYRGKDVAWIQVPYLYPTFMVLLLATAFAGTVLFIARLTGLAMVSVNSNRASGASPPTQPATE